MCDKKNSVRFTNTECVVLSSDYKLPDETHVLLKVPRENNMYNVDLKNVVPSGGLTCLFAKATLDESNLWHRRLGHINFKTMNKLVKGKLVRGLPLKIFKNNHTCVACQKGKQHKASYLLGKFDGKADEGFLVRYSVNYKAFRVFNNRTRIVLETLHINFLENKPNVAGIGPKWLFDFNTLTMSMNYQPVITGNQPSDNAGIQENLEAGKIKKETVYAQQYVLLPLWSTSSQDPQNSDDDVADVAFDVKENENDVHVSINEKSVKKSIDEKVQLKREYDSWVNERQMQTTEEKDTSNKSRNDAHDDGADIRAIYNEEPMAEVQTTAEIDIFAIGQQHTEQPELNNKGEVHLSIRKRKDSEFGCRKDRYLINQGFKEFSSDEQAMTSDHNSSELRLHNHNNEQSSSKLVPDIVPSADKTATS
nr:ribonuclease H-like domain-containing protein [Tanacetum cinerariifolium]